MTSDKKPSDLTEQINENLRRVYQEEVGDEVPERFKKLLEELKKQGSKE